MTSPAGGNSSPARPIEPQKHRTARDQDWGNGYKSAINMLLDEATFEDYFRARAHRIAGRGLDAEAIETLVGQLPSFQHAQLLAQYLEDDGTFAD